MRRQQIVAAAVFLAVLFLAGCSRPGSSGVSAPSPDRSSPESPGTSAMGTPTPTTSASPNCTNATVVAGWSVRRRAAQVVTVPVLDFNLTAVSAEVRDGAGGVLFLGNVAPPDDLAQQIRNIVHSSPGRPLVMVDQEGGGVQRLGGAVTSMPWPRGMAATMSPAAVRALAARVGRQMKALGVTVDLAPVVDVDGRPGPTLSNPDGARSFSADPTRAATYAIAFMHGLRDVGVLPVLKHFPGLGGSTTNTDLGPAATEPLQTLRRTGLVPFRRAISARAPAIMISNASVPGLTDRPASLSGAAITGLLRRRLHFHGLVLTDSLSAGAVTTAVGSLPEAAVDAIRSGADLVLFGSTLNAHELALLSQANLRRSFSAIVTEIIGATRTGRLPQRRLNAAATAVVDAAGLRLCG